ncbi:glycoside hydrolase [Clostridium sp. P21]|uniref:Glycoside hydrolase n=1 Tax=Clostridium muellerianum TaxID=2716538 RepID=A0A7Y0EJV7_9CLOT|nr:C40 family peptidase [Clostridium muellerianum]NMM64826.1 glycoside hydrolase [Clostridium muellerianum]
MNSLLKKSILALTMSIVFTTTAYAEPVQNNANNGKTTIESLQINIEKLDNEIETVMKQTDDNNKQIAATEASIKNTQTELQDAEANLNKEKDLFNKRVKTMYINGFDGYLNVLLQSKDIGDLISNTDTLVKLINLNQDTINKYKQNKDLVSNKKDNLVAKNNTLLALKADNEKKLTQLNSAKESQKKLLIEAQAAQNSYSGSDQVALADAFKYLDSIKSKASSNSPSDIDAVIAYATTFLGTPYVWGGTSPKPGFDCSGFTQYVCAHFGVSIGRTTYDQINDGTEVSRSSLKPGDLIFFGTASDPHHVGMYIGFGAYIHAPHTGDVIKISPLTRSDYLTARRVFK